MLDKYITGNVEYILEKNLTVNIAEFSCTIKLDAESVAELIDNINKTMTGEIIEDKRLVFDDVIVEIVPDVYPDRSTWQFINKDNPSVRGVIFAENIVQLKKELSKY